jgi:methionine sulfoxide reductase heme-binding subunit
MTHALWYAGRGTGLISLVLLTVVVALGIATRSGRPLPGLPRFAIVTVHRNASLLAVALLVIHIGSLLFDPYARLRALDAVLPFDADYRPLWTGLGAVAFDLLLALIVTSLVRHRLGRRRWRAIHLLAYAAWPTALLHGLKAGTDAGQTWFLIIALLCLAVVAAAIGWRLSETYTEYVRARRDPYATRSLEGAFR